ncbi:MAG: uroporphyrinogen-III synthase [Planctomycetaceae bacterium]
MTRLPNRNASDAPLRFLSFESRRAEEMRSLIARHGAEPTVAPSMREVPLSENDAVYRFAGELLAGRIDAVVFLTGVGADATLDILHAHDEAPAVLAALNGVRVIVRGPKPTAALKKRGVRIDVKAPEPNTWRELLLAMREAFDLAGTTIAVQEYGKANDSFYDELRSLGATVLPVPVYRWTLPEDTAPLEQAIYNTAYGVYFDVFAFTSAQQVEHVLTFAERLGMTEYFTEALRNGVIVSIGPTCTETLREYNLPPDLEASPPKMGQMVRLAVEQGKAVLERKRAVNDGGTA